MEKSEILKKLNIIFIDTFDNDSMVLTYDTSATDLEDWDSFNHIQLVVAMEEEFNIKFTAKEIQSWGNVGETIDCIISKNAWSKIKW